MLIALQLALEHWFYLYLVWFLPLALVALFSGRRIVSIELRARRPRAGGGADDHGHQPRVLVRGVVAHRHLGAEDRDRLLALDADHAAARAGHPDVGDVGGPARQHAGVGGRDVRVGADHGGHSAVEEPAHRDLLARRLGVHVDQHVVGAGHLAAARRRRWERGRGRLHEQVAGEVHDAERGAVVALEHARAAAGLGRQEVRRPQDARCSSR